MALVTHRSIFKQFNSVLASSKQVDKPKGVVFEGFVKLYKTKWTDDYFKHTAESFSLKKVKENAGSYLFEKSELGFQVIMVFNRNDKSLLIAIEKMADKIY